MKNLITYLFFGIGIMLITGCDESDPPIGDSYISATIDGEQFRTNNEAYELMGEEFIIAELTRFNGFVLAIGGAQLKGDKLTVVGIGFGYVSYEDLQPGLELSNGDANLDQPFALGTYQVNEGEDKVINSASDENGSATVRVTAIDKEKRLISGEFEFVSVDEGIGNQMYQVTNGVFENIQY